MSDYESGLQYPMMNPIEEPQPGPSGLEPSLNYSVQDRMNFRYHGEFIPLVPLVLLLYYSFPLFHLFLISSKKLCIF